MSADVGLIGLAVMGENLILNMESKGAQFKPFRGKGNTTEWKGRRP